MTKKGNDSGRRTTNKKDHSSADEARRTEYKRAEQEALARTRANQEALTYARASQDQLVNQFPGGLMGLGAYSQLQQAANQQMAAMLGYNPTPKEVKYEGIVVGELIGWKWWNISKVGLLCSPQQSVIWLPETFIEADTIPTEKNSNGIYAHNQPIEGSGKVFGTIYMWGEVLESTRGYRSQFAQVRSIDGIEGYKEPIISFFRGESLLSKLRRLYNVGSHYYAIQKEKSDEHKRCSESDE